ncbi:hypothetical protein DSM106972_066000 [Dulcicalothrix desertica PCC 7102]|uniref:Uncharacterized protein n=1 Tax=Dulcicalothrix desertica PCC 7102 TaxID=232991 RepID=A0A3S1AID4_9CYAN|nr:hypothetical protein [Dulcicalothrix desertica]RUT01503.1 hypothetical protein DSM106972_066000 [Dulcicalothrix desertica PCC 7102]
MTKNRRSFDVDYSEGGAIMPTNRLQNMLNQVQQQGSITSQSGYPNVIDTEVVQPIEVKHITSPVSNKAVIPRIEILPLGSRALSNPKEGGESIRI